MAGIVSYGAYIPKYRIDRKIIYKAMGWLNPATFMKGEKAVVNYDEDSITMAVSAGVDCLNGIKRSSVDAMFLASTTLPYKERQSAQILSTAFNFQKEIRTADFTNTAKAGTSALLSALDAITAQTSGNVMVCASDCRTGKPGSPQEEIFGDGAASLLVGSKDVVADFIGSYSVSHDFVDHWRADSDQFDRQWEDRFIRDVGYKTFISEAISGVLGKYGVKVHELAKAAYPCLYAGGHRNIATKLGLNPEQVQDSMLVNLGYTGTSNPLMLLVAALETAKPGDKIAVASFGTGSDALLFEVTDKINDIRENIKGVKKYLNVKRELKSYEKMISFRNVLPLEKGIRGEKTPFTALSELWRSRDQILGLCGSKCQKCGTPQYPVQRVCVNPDCGAVNQMEPYCFSDKKGKLATYTGDNLAFSPNPPAIYGIVDFEGGGRFWFDLTDVELEETHVGMEVEMSFRKKYIDDQFGIYGYFWKAVPII